MFFCAVSTPFTAEVIAPKAVVSSSLPISSSTVQTLDSCLNLLSSVKKPSILSLSSLF